MKKYVFFDHTADVLFEAYGKSLDKLFTNAALALEETQVKLTTVTAKTKRTISLTNPKIDMLLFDFLQELIYLKDAEELLFSKFKVNVSTKTNSLVADCWGEKINPKKQKLIVDAKAITLHQFEVKNEKNTWKARVIVDI
ncbi:MAG TPA: archease [Candidatus Nanoarchaeia archaeon]|nr:archease [Candidatus Nanoarchaeia archaeon]